MSVTLKIGFVPSYRNRWTPWTEKMRVDNLAMLKALPGVQVYAPSVAADGETLSAVSGATPHGAIHNLDEGETVAEFFQAQRIDALVICPLDFGDERSACKIAEKLNVPVFLYATKEPPVPERPSLARVSDSYCGNLGISSGLHRRRIGFQFGGLFFPDEPGLKAQLDLFLRAVAVGKGLLNARIGQVGVRPPTFETVSYDEGAMVRKFGQNVIWTNLDDIVAAAKDYADDAPEVLEAIARVRASVPTITVADDYLINSAKFELALADFWRSSGLSALAVQCWYSIQREMGISLCASFGRLTNAGMLTACEADVLGALSMIASHRASLGEDLPHFVDWTIQHRDDPNLLLAWHCGNAPVCLAADPSKIALRSRADMTGETGVNPGDPQAGLCQFQVKPGLVTFCRLAEFDGDWKMLITTGSILPSDETNAGTWAWVRVRDHARLYRTLVEQGFIHHASMIHGNQTRALVQACKFLDIQPVVVE